jgi:hypothetical protein
MGNAQSDVDAYSPVNNGSGFAEEKLIRDIRDNISRGVYFKLCEFQKSPRESTTPVSYNEKTSQKMLEILVRDHARGFRDMNADSYVALVVLFERNPDPNKCDSEGKPIIEYLFYQGYYNLVIRMLNIGAAPSKTILKSCILSPYSFGLSTSRINAPSDTTNYRAAIIKALCTAEVGTLPIDEQLVCFDKFLSKVTSQFVLHTSTRVKAIQNFEADLIFIHSASK